MEKIEEGKNICIFGDSITWGAVDPVGGGWVTRLRKYFESSGLRCDKDTDVYNLGVSGDNTGDLLKRFKIEAFSREPDVIIFAIGANDSQFVISNNQNRISTGQFKDNLEELISQAKELTNKIVFIGLTRVDEGKTKPIPWNLDKIYLNKYLEEYDRLIKAVAEKHEIPYIKVSDCLETEDLQDGLHPSSRGHEKLFLFLKDKIEALL